MRKTFVPYSRSRAASAAVLLFVVGWSMFALVRPAPADAAPLATRLSRVVARSGMASSTSVVVYDTNSGNVVFARRPRRMVPPASNEKILTAAAALKVLGPDYRFHTKILLNGVQTGSTFSGDVYLVGGGDPTLGSRAWIRRSVGSGSNAGRLAAALRARGITTIDGRLIADESRYDDQRFVRAWPVRYRYRESAALGALTFNHVSGGNAAGARLRRRPARHAALMFSRMLRARGIRVTRGITVGRAPAGAVEAADLPSPPLSSILSFMMKTSDNFTAEIMLKELAASRAAEGQRGSTAAGAGIARRTLRSMGVPVRGMRIVDGSGLAHSNRTSTWQLVGVLSVMDADEDLSDPFQDALATNGGWGTLRRRLARVPLIGRLMGKTGTLPQTSALSGFAVGGGDRRWGFAVISSRPSGSIDISRAHRLQDRVALQLLR